MRCRRWPSNSAQSIGEASRSGFRASDRSDRQKEEQLVKIRLRRMGAKKHPFYRLVVADARSPRDGRFIEHLGYYDPMTDPVQVKIDEDKGRFIGKAGRNIEAIRTLVRVASLRDRKRVFVDLATPSLSATNFAPRGGRRSGGEVTA